MMVLKASCWGSKSIWSDNINSFGKIFRQKIIKETKINKLIVLDVEGTIRSNFTDDKVQEDHYQNLASNFKKLKALGCEIVLASNLESEEYPELKKQFESLGIDQYISYYEPKEKGDDGRGYSKIRKVLNYIKEYASEGIEILPSDVRFYDDTEINLLMLKLDGFTHNYLINNSEFKSSLNGQLIALINELEKAQ